MVIADSIEAAHRRPDTLEEGRTHLRGGAAGVHAPPGGCPRDEERGRFYYRATVLVGRK
jgi:hypothetical protein